MNDLQEKLQKLVIETIHNLPYDKAIIEEISKGFLMNIKSKDHFEKSWDGVYSVSMIRKAQRGISVVSGVREITLKKENLLIYKETEDFFIEPLGLPITLSRIMEALNSLQKERSNKQYYSFVMYGTGNNCSFAELFICNPTTIKGLGDVILSNPTNKYWKLIKKDGQECTHLDQSEQMIKELIKLLE